MGSEGPRTNVTIHVTGFKKFQGVPENPTETIVSKLKDYVAMKQLPPGIILGSCTILDTAGEGARPALYKILENSLENQDTSSNDTIVWLHLGVNSGASKFAIEQQAYNEATFRCPDELGWQPQQLPIVNEDGETSRVRKTCCSVDAILKLLKEKGFDVTLSKDAGRFVCNYVYYHSLRFAEEKGHKSLFVHVPLFSKMDEETQMNFTVALLEDLNLSKQPRSWIPEQDKFLGRLESFDVYRGEEADSDDESCGHHSKVVVNVDSFGAVGDGVSDDTQAFISAWNQACSTKRSVFLVPKERHYLVNATKFQGPCAKSLTIRIDGTIVAPDEPTNWDPKLARIWLNFHNLTGVSFQGKGVIDGSGRKWWAASCKKNKSNPCKGAPAALTISSSSAVKVRGLTIQNSQQMHFVISRCDSVRVSNVQVSAPEDSPNTDGIHISESANVVLQNCKIGTGDDCVSIVNASANIKMKTIYCGPGHGISIGSLGKDNSTAVVSNIVLSGAFIRDATNGLRIKTWQGGSGYVKAVRFENVRMESVANPIIIDQFYCDSPKTCINQTSAVEISQIMYRNISGTTKSKQAMKFACSDTVPCSNIILDNVNLEKEDGTAEVYCNSATGIGHGVINPSADCLTSTDEDCDPVQVEEKFIHTEL